MSTKAEFAASLEQITQHVAKVGDETRTLIARVVDDLVPDAPATEPAQG